LHYLLSFSGIASVLVYLALNPSDFLMFSLESGEGGHVICYEMEDIEKRLGFGRNSLVRCCMIFLDELNL
jgi:hypothetical protein